MMQGAPYVIPPGGSGCLAAEPVAAAGAGNQLKHGALHEWSRSLQLRRLFSFRASRLRVAILYVGRIYHSLH
jgi:hypothetical protein